jgi:hypothetical protein
VSDACNWRFTETPYNVDGHQNNNSLFVVSCAFVRRLHCAFCRGLLRHKGEKSFRAVANTESQTPEEEIDTYSSAREFAKTKESLADSIPEPDVEEQIKAQKAFADADPGRKSISQSSRN